MTGSPAAAQHLRDLAWLRRVRDRIDREDTQPLDLQALACGVYMSSGHLSRQFKPIRLIPGRSDRADHPEHGHAHDQQSVADPRRTQQPPAEKFTHSHGRTIRPAATAVVNPATYPPYSPSGDANPQARTSNLNDPYCTKFLVGICQVCT